MEFIDFCKKLSGDRPGLSQKYAQCLCEALLVVLESQGHSPESTFIIFREHDADTLRPFTSVVFETAWSRIGAVEKSTWNELDFATEQAAYAVAIVAIEHFLGLTVIERSRKRTGFDYWLGLKDHPLADLFQQSHRLEVSGIRSGGSKTIVARLRDKRKQANAGGIVLPLIVAVIEFSTPTLRVLKNDSA